MNTHFELFMKQVDEILVSKIGLDHESLPDYLWYDDYENGATPEEAIEGFAEYYEYETLLW